MAKIKNWKFIGLLVSTVVAISIFTFVIKWDNSVKTTNREKAELIEKEVTVIALDNGVELLNVTHTSNAATLYDLIKIIDDETDNDLETKDRSAHGQVLYSVNGTSIDMNSEFWASESPTNEACKDMESVTGIQGDREHPCTLTMTNLYLYNTTDTFIFHRLGF